MKSFRSCVKVHLYLFAIIFNAGGMKIMKTDFWKKAAHDVGVDVAGGIFIGLGIYNFAAKAGFPMAGVSGIALIFYRFLHLPVGLGVFLMNIPIAIICYRMLGRQFFLNSVRTIIITSLMTDVVAPLFPVYDGDRMLAAICTGLLSGIGYALIFMNASSTGGMDFVTMAIRSKYPYFSIGKITLALDCIIVAVGGLMYQDMDALIYGLLITWLLTTVIDQLMYGTDSGKMALIVTDDGKEIAKEIGNYIHRGSTILKGRGSYTGYDRDVIMCACSKRQMYRVRKLVKQIDPHAFIVIMESNEVVGEGFKKE